MRKPRLFQAFTTSGAPSAIALFRSLLGAGIAASLVGGCGGAGDEGGGGPPAFGAQNPGGVNPGGAGSGNAGAPSSASCTAGVNCPPTDNPEAMNPMLPVSMNPMDPLNPIARACTPNQVSCEGNVLNRCNAEGTQVTPQDCAATGGTCGMGASGPACLTASCTPGQVTCESANTVGTCMADGSGFAVTRCPNGTNCEGNGVCAPVSCDPTAMPSRNGGQSTVYFFGQGTDNFGNVACRYGIDVGFDDGSNNIGNAQNGIGDSVNGIANPTFFGAIATANFQGAQACGACAELRYQGRTVNITVVDECPIGDNPTCTDGHIDLSREAWNALTGNAAGTEISGVNWNFVPCDTNGNIEIELLDPTNIYWNEFVVRNHKYPIERAEVLLENGTWIEADRQAYNAFFTPDHLMGTFRVRLTDVNGAIVEQQLDVNQAGFQRGEGQFDCQ